MRIAYVAAGAGAMHCGACARAVTLVRELAGLGEDVCVVPLYTPLRSDVPVAVRTAPIFLGGINVYLQQASRLCAWLPGAVRRMLDRPALLEWASSRAIETDPRKLGKLTVSVLAGADGRQRSEVDRLLEYLRDELRPEVVHLAHSLLSGLAPQVKARLGVPVVCTLQGEEHFVAAMPSPHRERAGAWLVRNAGSIDRFICCAEERVGPLSRWLGVEASRMRVIRTGVAAEAFRPNRSRRREPFTVGYLSAIRAEKGLDLLIDAVGSLVREEGREARLAVAGQVLDKAYWRRMQRRVAQNGLTRRMDYHGELSAEQKVEFLHDCSVFVLPSRLAESRGVAAMEAMAAGVPVMVPDRGVFPELVARTGGGALFAAEEVGALAGALARWMDDPAGADEVGRRGMEAIARDYSPRQMAEATLAEYRQLMPLGRTDASAWVDRG